MTSAAARMAALATRADRVCPQLETWPTHFQRRAMEMGAISRVFDFAAVRRTLELGCGNAIATALIAGDDGCAVATDLFHERVETHSINLHRAQQLLQALDLPQCHVAAASGYSLPFVSGTFDLVFSLFALEHIPDRETTLAEIARVLNGRGVTLHAVPGAMWALSAPLRFPVYLVQRVTARLRRRPVAAGEHDAAPVPVSAANAPPAGRMTWALFRQRYPAFPLPPPHGEYRSWVQELLAYRRSAWVALFERNGFDVIACEPINMLSADLFLHGPQARRQRWFRFDQWLAAQPFARAFGQFYVVVAKPRTACP